MLTSAAIGLAALLLLLCAWVAVQRAWRHRVADGCADPDALAGRLGCQRNCGTGPCKARADAAREEEEVQA